LQLDFNVEIDYSIEDLNQMMYEKELDGLHDAIANINGYLIERVALDVIGDNRVSGRWCRSMKWAPESSSDPWWFNMRGTNW
jgi:hypothetical protein